MIEEVALGTVGINVVPDEADCRAEEAKIVIGTEKL